MNQPLPPAWKFSGAPLKTRVGDVEIAYERAGSGEPVLLIMGLAAGRRVWKYQIGSLSEKCEVVFFDNRGAGDSDSPEQEWSLDDMVDDALAVMDAVGWQRAHIVGASIGGSVAQEVVLSHPGRAISLALISANHGGPDAVPTEPAVLEEIRPAMGGDPKAGLAAVRHSFSDGFLEEHPEVVEQLFEETAQHSTGGSFNRPSGSTGQRAAVDSRRHETPSARTGSPHGLRNQIFAAVRWAMAGGSASRLGEIGVPTIVLHGGKDKLVPVANGKMLAEKIPGARLRVWEDAGHNLMMEKASEVNRELLAHFDAASSAP